MKPVPRTTTGVLAIAGPFFGLIDCTVVVTLSVGVSVAPQKRNDCEPVPTLSAVSVNRTPKFGLTRSTGSTHSVIDRRVEFTILQQFSVLWRPTTTGY
jgi:hypothetical protein